MRNGTSEVWSFGPFPNDVSGLPGKKRRPGRAEGRRRTLTDLHEILIYDEY
jgi:hypothetical protein